MKNTLRRWRATWSPDMYHGWGKSKSYFEGWYIKIVDESEQFAFAFIPGISMSPDGTAHAFIQVLNGKACTSAYHRFEAKDFVPSETDFDVQVADNQFSAQQLTLDLPNIKGTLRFQKQTPWPKMLGAPGIMGWFSFVPFMECYHGVVSLNHSISGTLTVDGKTIDFGNGRGYIEKDWGVSFPKGWIWLQTNHFFKPQQTETSPISLIASVAHIPFLGTHFIGYIVGFWFNQKLYRFATYTGAKMKSQLIDNQVFLSFKDRKNQLDITATKAGTGNLVSPIQGEMTGKVSESLQAEIHVRFYENDILIFEGTGRNAGLEVAGAVDILWTETWRR
jgi:tocopherol cyclase